MVAMFILWHFLFSDQLPTDEELQLTRKTGSKPVCGLKSRCFLGNLISYGIREPVVAAINCANPHATHRARSLARCAVALIATSKTLRGVKECYRDRAPSERSYRRIVARNTIADRLRLWPTLTKPPRSAPPSSVNCCTCTSPNHVVCCQARSKLICPLLHLGS